MQKSSSGSRTSFFAHEAGHRLCGTRSTDCEGVPVGGGGPVPDIPKTRRKRFHTQPGDLGPCCNYIVTLLILFCNRVLSLFCNYFCELFMTRSSDSTQSWCGRRGGPAHTTPLPRVHTAVPPCPPWGSPSGSSRRQRSPGPPAAPPAAERRRQDPDNKRC